MSPQPRYAELVAWRRHAVALGIFVCALAAMPSVAVAQIWDPAAAISAYSAALNVHDLPAALALFDQYGSASDAAGHHFEGRAGLTEFLLISGFSSPDAHISTENLYVVANRAVWTYSCSCASGTTEVRLVMNREKISVFAVMPPRPLPQPRADTGLQPWLAALGAVMCALAGGAGLWRRHSASPVAPRQAQGHLLAGLRQSRDQAATRSRRTLVGSAPRENRGSPHVSRRMTTTSHKPPSKQPATTSLAQWWPE